MGTEDVRFDWPEFLPAERIKETTTEIAFELVAFAALVDGARGAKYDSGTFTLACYIIRFLWDEMFTQLP
jgi:hypothetical protein